MNIGEFVDAIELQRQEEQTLALPFEDRFQLLTDSVYQLKYNDKVQRLVKLAKFRLTQADTHNIFYHEKRSLNRSVMNELASCRFIDEYRSVVFQGYTSSGKTFLGCALGREACRQLHRVRYVRLPDLLAEYTELALVPGGKSKLLNKYATFRVLILDEWLMSDLSKAEIEFIFELSERRFDTSSTVFCTLYKQEEWIRRLGGGTYAESIVERFAHNTTWVETGDMNMREIFATNELR